MQFTQEDIILAPLAGYTDLPFRRACRQEGLKYAYTALIDAGALVYGNRENNAILARGDDEPWLGVQLLGSRLDFLEAAAPLLERLDYDEFNFNMGCPVRKVIQREAGAALLGNPEHALECVRLLRRLVRRPFTVKLRILDEADPTPTVDFCRRLQEAGVEGLTIHGRLASKIYSGPVATEVISVVREALQIPVTANGGIFTVADAESLKIQTGCERVMVARGAIGNPWVFKSLLAGRDYVPSRDEVCDKLAHHIEGMMEQYGEEEGLVNGRKIILGYMGGKGFHRALKLGVCAIRFKEEFMRLLEQLRQDGLNH